MGLEKWMLDNSLGKEKFLADFFLRVETIGKERVLVLCDDAV